MCDAKEFLPDFLIENKLQLSSMHPQLNLKTRTFKKRNDYPTT
jgi:hypothetical protein